MTQTPKITYTRYINKETKEILDNPGEVRKHLQPKKLPKTFSKAVLDQNNIAFLYSGDWPKIDMFQSIEEDGIEEVNGVYKTKYTVKDTMTDEEKQTLGETKFNKAKENKINELKDDLDLRVSKITSDAGFSEKLSWSKQETEAKAYLEDNTALTPYLDILIQSRDSGESKTELCNKIILKSDAYGVFHAKVLGDYHNKLDKVNSSEFTISTIMKDLETLSSIVLVKETED